MSNEPINGNEPAPPPTGIEQTPPSAGVLIARVPVTLQEGQSIFQVELREPAIVRAAAFWIHTPQVLASAMRGVRSIPMPLMFVECQADGEMKQHTFAFVPTDAALGVKDGFVAKYAATAMLPTQNGLLSGHLFEIVERSS